MHLCKRGWGSTYTGFYKCVICSSGNCDFWGLKQKLAGFVLMGESGRTLSLNLVPLCPSMRYSCIRNQNVAVILALTPHSTFCTSIEYSSHMFYFPACHMLFSTASSSLSLRWINLLLRFTVAVGTSIIQVLKVRGVNSKSAIFWV